jgi:molybdate-binding protein
VALGILPAAKMLGLDFVHFARERFDLIIPEQSIVDRQINGQL